MTGGGLEIGTNYGVFTYVLLYPTYDLYPRWTRAGNGLTPDSRSQENSDLTQNVKPLPGPVLLGVNISVFAHYGHSKVVQKPKTY